MSRKKLIRKIRSFSTSVVFTSYYFNFGSLNKHSTDSLISLVRIFKNLQHLPSYEDIKK